jgi:hypothetical protein
MDFWSIFFGLVRLVRETGKKKMLRIVEADLQEKVNA